MKFRIALKDSHRQLENPHWEIPITETALWWPHRSDWPTTCWWEFLEKYRNIPPRSEASLQTDSLSSIATFVSPHLMSRLRISLENFASFLVMLQRLILPSWLELVNLPPFQLKIKYFLHLLQVDVTSWRYYDNYIIILSLCYSKQDN